MPKVTSADPSRKEHEDRLEWLSLSSAAEFDLDAFDLDQVNSGLSAAHVRSGKLVHVSGAPGSGKTTLKPVPLASELGWALLTKDRIKETLHDAFGRGMADLAWSRGWGRRDGAAVGAGGGCACRGDRG